MLVIILCPPSQVVSVHAACDALWKQEQGK